MRPCCGGMGRWCWASVAGCSVMSMTPTMPFRRPFWCWPARRPTFGRGTWSDTGSTVSLTAPPSAPVVTRPDPAGARIGGQRPVSRVPPIASVDNVPVAVDPDIIRTRAPRLNPYHARWRWRTDLNPNRDLAENTSCGQQSKRNEFCFHGLRLPVQYSLQMLTPLDRSEYPSTLHVFSAGWWPFSTRYGAPEDRTLPGVTGLRNGSACRSALGRP